MSAVYPTLKTKLIEWALAGASPSLGEFRLALCDDTFAYSPTHLSLSDIAGSVVHLDYPLVNPTYAKGKIDADDMTLTDLTPSEVIKVLVIYIAFDAETQLVCAITESDDLPLPVTIVDEKLIILWDAQGICQI